MTQNFKQLTFTEGDVTLTIDIHESGTVELDITDKYGGPYNEGSWQSFLLEPEQGQELQDALNFGKCEICGLRNEQHKMSCSVTKVHRLTAPLGMIAKYAPTPPKGEDQ